MFSHTNMKELLVLTVFMIKLTCIKEVNADAIVPVTNENYAKCSGSLLVITKRGAEKRFGESKNSTKFIAKSLEVEGCGCFDLFKRPNYKSTVKRITQNMRNVSGDVIGFTVRSVQKVSCEAYAQPTWVVVCIVVGLVLLVAIIAIVLIRCYRKFNPVPTEDHSIP